MFFSKIRRAKTENVSVDARPDEIPAGRRIDYVKLEERRVLNATFAFDLMAAELTLENFADSDAGINQVLLSQDGNDFVFTLGDGVWSEGGSVAGLDFTLSDGNRVLTVNGASSSLSSVLFNDNTADTFDIRFGDLDFASGSVNVTGSDGTFGQISEATDLVSGIRIGNLSFACTSIDLSNATNDFGVVSGTATEDIRLSDASDLHIPFLQTDNGSIAITAEGNITVDNDGATGLAGLNILDTANLDDPTDAITVVSLDGDVHVFDAIQNNSAGEVFIVAAGTDGDVLLSDLIATESGSVQISALDQITFTAESAIIAAADGNVLVSANLNGDGSGDDSGTLQMSDGSSIDAGTGTIAITNEGSSGGDLFLSEIRTNNGTDQAVAIASAGRILDATASESANVLADGGGLRLTALGDIGGDGLADIDTHVQTLAFVTPGRIALTDATGGLVIAGIGPLDSSTADGGASIRTNGQMTIRTDVRVAGDSEFTAEASLNADDDILIANGALIQLDSFTPAMVTLSAGDDIIFDSGRIVTTGNDAHQVNLLADNETEFDGDIGSVINTAELSSVTIETGLLVISSGDGIGQSSEFATDLALRINVDSIQASNSTNNGIRLVESDSIAIESLFNSGRLVQLTAGSNILDGDGLLDDLDIDGGEILIVSTGGSVGSDSADIFKGVFDPIEIRATSSLDISAPAGLIAVDQLDQVTTANLNASSVVFYSDSDLNAIASLSVAAFAADNIAFIADGNNDGSGILTLPQSVAVTADLRIEGHEVIARDSLSNPVVAQLTASRLLFSTDNTVQINTTVESLDLEIDAAARIAGQAVQISNSMSVELVDLNCDGQLILTTHDDVSMVVAGDLLIEDAASLGTGSLFVAANGDVSQSTSGSIMANGLALVVSGSTLLDAGNDVNSLAAATDSQLVFRDVNELVLDSVTAASGSPFEMTVTGLTAIDQQVKLIADGDLSIAAPLGIGSGTAFLSVGGDLSQSHMGVITANALGLMVDGWTILNADNEIDSLAANNIGFTNINNIVDLEIGAVNVFAGSDQEMSLVGLNIDSDLKLEVTGNLSIKAQVVTPGNIFLTVSGDISQAATGTVSANSLGFLVGGSTVLDADNLIDTMAGTFSDLLVFNNLQNLTIDTVIAASGTPFQMSATGITNTGGFTKLILDGNLQINQTVNADSHELFLDTTGDVNQTSMGIISAAGLGLMVEGRTVLDADNQISVLGADNVGYTILNATNDLVVGTVTIASGGQHEMSAIGVTTIDSDVKLSVFGELHLEQSISLGGGNLFLQATEDILQSDAGTITANSLALMVDGTSILDAANDVNVFAAANSGFTLFNAIDDLVVGTVTAVAQTPFAMTVSGIDTGNHDLKLQSGSDLQIDEPIVAGTADVFLMVGGDINQDTTGTITSARLGISVAGSTRLDASNDVNELAASNIGFTWFNDIDDLVISRVSVAAGTAYEMNATGVSTVNQDIKIVGGDALWIDDPISAGLGNVLLSANGPLTQTTADADGLDGTISAAGLGLMVSGPVELSNGGNHVDQLAADVAGQVSFNNGSDLQLAQLTIDGMTIRCVDINGSLELTVAGELTQTAAILVGGRSDLNVTGNICLTGAGCDDDSGNDNDFVGVVNASAGATLQIVDSNELIVEDAMASHQIRLRSGDGATGALRLNGSIITTDADGQVLLQSHAGIFQDAGTSVIRTGDLMLGSTIDSEASSGQFLLRGNNTVERIAAHLQDHLEFTNRRDLQISPLVFVSQCGLFSAEFGGLQVDSLVVNVTADEDTTGNLTDAANAVSVINRTASLNVIGDIVLGDGAASLNFSEHVIDQLIVQNVSSAFLSVSAAGNAGNADGSDIASTANVSLYVDSTIILSNINVSNTLFVDTIEGLSANGSEGDILQTMVADETPSIIRAQHAGLVSNASVQLTNTMFTNVAVEANQQVSQLITPFIINSQIGSTFTGSIDADVFTDPDAPPFVPGGDGNPVDGVFDVEDGFVNDGFFSGNNAFVNASRIGSIIVNGQSLNVVAFDSLGLDPIQLEDVQNSSAAITTRGDTYLETTAAANLDILADVNVTVAISNITVISGDDLTLGDGVELRRMNATQVVGVVNTIQHGFAMDQFTLNDPRSVIEAPGNIAFSDFNAQLDSANGFQNFDFYFGNPGETSFNLIVGWFVNGVSASDAINPAFQPLLLQGMDDLTEDFLLSDFGNFGQGISAYAIRLDSMTEGFDQALALTNISQFSQSFFAESPFFLSQIFLTNDARINLFEDGGSTDLNFAQEVLPTQTVVQNPESISVETPQIDVPVALNNPPTPPVSFVNLIPTPETIPLTVEPQPESYFIIRYTADDDGIFEDEFKWEDPNDDPDAIRAAIEDATLNDDDEFWPESDDDDSGNWTDKIKKGQVKPGLYYIFEVQEGQELPEPVDVPIDRTDLENLAQPDLEISSFWNTETMYLDGDRNLFVPWQPGEATARSRSAETGSAVVEAMGDTAIGSVPEVETGRLSEATRNASLGIALLLADCLLRAPRPSRPRNTTENEQPLESPNLFSRASRFVRRQKRRFR